MLNQNLTVNEKDRQMHSMDTSMKDVAQVEFQNAIH
jgi:hypothetical protein